MSLKVGDKVRILKTRGFKNKIKKNKVYNVAKIDHSGRAVINGEEGDFYLIGGYTKFKEGKHWERVEDKPKQFVDAYIQTSDDHVQDILVRWERQLDAVKQGGFGEPSEVEKYKTSVLGKLPEPIDPLVVDAVMGNNTWSLLGCNDCFGLFRSVLIVGESSTCHMCSSSDYDHVWRDFYKE